MRVALNVFTRREAGIDIADPFMVRNKIDTFTDPHGCREIAIDGCERLKLSIPFGVNPDLPCSAAAIAFPARRFTGQSTEDNAAITAEINMVRGTVRETLRFARRPHRFSISTDRMPNPHYWHRESSCYRYPS